LPNNVYRTVSFLGPTRIFNVLISSIIPLIETYGLVFVAVLICLESIALPVPGETVLILAAVFAGTRHQLHIVAIVLTAATAAFVGQVIGYMIGRQFGYRLLLRYGGYLRITEGRIKLGEYLFLRHGITIVIVARFLPVLRSIIGILAGANRMPAPSFLFANIVGALVWTSVVGYLSFLFGNLIHQVGHWIAIVVGVVAVTAIVVGVNFLRRHEERLTAEAELALPGRLKSP
jgi:membrane protein DedA with SNARE-associated domain